MLILITAKLERNREKIDIFYDIKLNKKSARKESKIRRALMKEL